MSKASSMRGKCFQPLKLFWHKDSWKGRSSSHVLYLLSFKAWHMVLPSRGRRILFFEDRSAISGASLVGQKAEENAALDEIVEAMWEDQKGNQDFQQVCQENFEGKLLHEMIIFSKKMAFTFPGQWPWTTSHGSGGKRWKRASKDFFCFCCAMSKNNFHGGCLKLFGVFLVQGIFHQPLHSCFFSVIAWSRFFSGAFCTPVFFIDFFQGTWCAERFLKKVT